MIKIKEIEIPTPKWKWWQILITIILVVLITKIDDRNAIEVLKLILEKWMQR